MQQRNFNELRLAKEGEGKFVCVGLDPKFKSVDDFPFEVKGESIEDKLFNFLVPIVEATADIAAWYKPNLSFFLQHGWQGVKALERLYEEMRWAAAGCVLVHDSKNGDIGDTNDGYVRFAFEILGADAITLHNYMGMQAMRPFLDRGDKGCFILVRTSNEGADEFQGLTVDAELDAMSSTQLHPLMPLYEVVARSVADEWNFNGNAGIVAGSSTSSVKDLKSCREAIGKGVPILCPGTGKQGGSAAEAYRLGSDDDGKSIGINSSSGITHAHQKEEHASLHWAEASRIEAQKLHDEITAARAA